MKDAEVPVVADPSKDPKRLAAFTRKVAMMLNSLIRGGYIVRKDVVGIKGSSFEIPGSAGGTVTSVALTEPTEFIVTGSPITGAGTFAVTKSTQAANKVWAGPTTGSAAVPTFRALVAADLPSGAGSPLTTKGDVYTFSTANARLPVGADGQLLSAASGQPTGLEWINPPATSPLTTKGDLYGYTSTNVRVPVGTDGQVLTAESSQASGVEWVTPVAPLGYLPLTTGEVGPVLVDDGQGNCIGVPFIE